jgi:hypothetical protein
MSTSWNQLSNKLIKVGIEKRIPVSELQIGDQILV